MPPALPQITSLPTLSTSERASILDLLFEPCTQLHTLAVSTLTTPFASYESLIAAIGAQLTALSASASTSDTAWLEAILSAHPRLGSKRVDSAQSRAEQAQLQAQGGAAEAETATLARLNREYEAAFPGLRYVLKRAPGRNLSVFVNGRGRPEIMSDMRRRIERADPKQEKTDAIQAMCEIAADRAKKLSG